MKVLITGGSGSLGRSLIHEFQQLPNQDLQIFSLTNNEFEHWQLEQDTNVIGILGDIREMERMQELFATFHFDAVIHAAAYKHVPYGERFPKEFYDTNVWGSYVIANVAKQYRVPKAILISSDKAVNPSNVYGQSKAKAEKCFMDCEYSAIRFVNFWGSRGSVIPLWQEQVKTKGYIEITDPTMERYFITLEDAAKFTIKCLDEYKPQTIWTPDNYKKWSLAELAEYVCPGALQRVIGNRGNEKQVEEINDTFVQNVS